MSTPHDPSTRHVEDDNAQERHKAQQESELLEKIPDHTDPAQERGERHKTGKSTATNGQTDPEPLPQQMEPDEA